jgi:hypothetical protein
MAPAVLASAASARPPRNKARREGVRLKCIFMLPPYTQG